jgi:hypothetical protein
MSVRGAARLAWSSWVLSLALGAAATVFYVLSASIPLEGRDRPPLYFLPILLAALLAYATVGAIVASRRPGNTVGWILCAVGVLLGIVFLAQGYADYTLVVRPGSLPGGEALIWATSWAGSVLNAAPALLLLLFPNGRLPSRRWRPVAWITVLAAAMAATGSALGPGVPNDDYPTVTNPVSIGGAFGDFLELTSAAGSVLGTAAIFLAAVAMVLRLRRARGEERQQLKWISFGGGIMAAFFLAGELVPGPRLVVDLLWAAGFVSLVCLPIAAGIAILRHRLYDIDLVINKALVYGPLTVSLALVYFGSVVLLQGLFRALTGQDSQLVIVASTLAIAALFSPLRRRIQDWVDRRFYRNKYDARKTLEAFGAKLRNETDLDALGTEMVAVVRETVQPQHASLWLRELAAKKPKAEAGG